MAVALMALVTLGLLALPTIDLVQAAMRPAFAAYVGIDINVYLEAARRWLATGQFYEPYQLAGPYQLAIGDVLYPPVALVLFVPFVVLPGFLWWALPLGITAWAVWKLRPDHTLWPFMALCVAWPPTVVRLVTGNPVMWVIAAVALGCLYRWPAALALFKPSLFPFALIGIRSKGWWITLGVGMLVSAAFAGLWFDWLTALENVRGAGIGYSLQEVPMVLLPIIAAIPVNRLRSRLDRRRGQADPEPA
jgi:hypothetical protein